MSLGDVIQVIQEQVRISARQFRHLSKQRLILKDVPVKMLKLSVRVAALALNRDSLDALAVPSIAYDTTESRGDLRGFARRVHVLG